MGTPGITGRFEEKTPVQHEEYRFVEICFPPPEANLTHDWQFAVTLSILSPWNSEELYDNDEDEEPELEF